MELGHILRSSLTNDGLEDTGFVTEVIWVPKRPSRIASASPPGGPCARSALERKARRTHERELLHKTPEGVGQMQIAAVYHIRVYESCV